MPAPAPKSREELAQEFYESQLRLWRDLGMGDASEGMARWHTQVAFGQDDAAQHAAQADFTEDEAGDFR